MICYLYTNHGHQTAKKHNTLLAQSLLTDTACALEDECWQSDHKQENLELITDETTLSRCWSITSTHSEVPQPLACLVLSTHTATYVLIATTYLMPKWSQNQLVLRASMALIAQRVGIHFGSCLLQQFLLLCTNGRASDSKCDPDFEPSKLGKGLLWEAGVLARTRVPIGQRRKPR